MDTNGRETEDRGTADRPAVARALGIRFKKRIALKALKLDERRQKTTVNGRFRPSQTWQPSLARLQRAILFMGFLGLRPRL
jgi:hypothetical protein